jgi:hypothetical protein
MSNRYRVEITQAQTICVTVVANTPQEAIERALRGEGDPGDPWQEEPGVKRVVKLEG